MTVMGQLLLMLFASSWVAAAPFYEVSQNLMVNNDPGFESGATYVNLTRVTTSPRSGSYCGKQTGYTAWNQSGFSGDPAGSYAYLTSTPITPGEVVAGRKYRLSVWNKNTVQAGEIYMGVECKDASGNLVDRMWKKIPNNSTSWKICEMEFVAPVGTAKLNPFFYIEATVIADPSLPDIFWDDIVLESVNKVADPGIERPSIPYTNAVHDSTYKHSGAYSGKQSYTSGTISTMYYNGADPIVECGAGERFRLTVWNKNNVPSSTSSNLEDRVAIGVRFINSSGTSIGYEWKAIPHNSSLWQACTLDFTTPTGTVKINPYLRIGSSVAGGYDIYWDDISAEPLNSAVDPGFEQSPTDFLNTTLDTSNAYSGTYCAKQNYSYGNTWNCIYQPYTFARCGANRSFCLTVKNKNNVPSSDSTNLDDRIAIGVRFINSTNTSISYVWKEIPHSSTSWQECSLEFTTPAGAVAMNPYMKIGKNIASGYDVYWDELSIEPSVVYASDYGTTHTAATINAAISAIGTDQRTLMLDGANWTVDGAGGHVTVPSNIVFKIADGTTVAVAPNYYLTIQGAVDLSPMLKFTGLGNVVISSSAVEAMPEWWGAAADNSTDCGPAIRKALASGAENIYFASQGNYLLSTRGGVYANSQEYMFDVPSDINIYGNGAKTASIKMAADVLIDSVAALGCGVFLVNDKQNVTVRNLTVDMNGYNNLVPSGTIKACYVLRAIDSEYISVKETCFKNTPGRNYVVFAGGSNNEVDACILLNGGTALSGNTYQDDFSSVYIDSTNTVCQRNIIRNESYPFDGSGGVELHASNTTCQKNYIARSYPAAYIFVDGRETSSYMAFNNNVAKECLQGVVLGSAIMEGTPGSVISNMSIQNNYFSLTRFTTNSHLDVLYSYAINMCYGGSSGVYVNLKVVDSTISGNTMDDLYTNTTVPRCNFISFGGFDNVTISNNTINNCSGDGIVIRGNPYDLNDVTISDNTISNFGDNSGSTNKTAIYFSLTGTSVYPLVLSDFDSDNVQILDNVISMDTSTSNAYAFYFNWGLTSTITNLLVEGNSITNANEKWGGMSSQVQVLP